MVLVLLNWAYILVITFTMGAGCLKRQAGVGYTGSIISGIVITTVYAQFFSLFYKVGLIANIILIISCIIIILKYKNDFKTYLGAAVKQILSWDGLLYIGVILLFAFATSRGVIHHDTNMYHAQAIRWYEEFGVVKGLANLQWQFAYNSSCFGFAALFSLGFLGSAPFHCTTGFTAVVLCIWALDYIKHFPQHKSHMADMCCVAVLLYALVNFTGFVSPASDYITMFLALYLIARWAQEIESGKNDIPAYALLSVLAVFIFTLKLSAGLMILLAVYPVVYLIKEKRYKEIGIYFSMGLLTVLPFLIRNVIISGWLLYPFPAVDLFNFDWKLPKQYVLIDSNSIKVWARCLYNPELVDMPVREWLPVWWSSQERYAQMLILTNVLACCLDVIIFIHFIVKRKKVNINVVLLNVIVFSCAAAWFLLAPFIRYGLAFLLALPMLSVGMWFEKKENSLYRTVSGCVVILMFFIPLSYWDHYFTDDVVFIKQNLTQPYYVRQKDYDISEMAEYDMNGVTVYYPKEGEVVGYKYFPSSAYKMEISNTELRGSGIEKGFRNTEYR